MSSAWATGAYELRYFVNNTYQRMATAEFTVATSTALRHLDPP